MFATGRAGIVCISSIAQFVKAGARSVEAVDDAFLVIHEKTFAGMLLVFRGIFIGDEGFRY